MLTMLLDDTKKAYFGPVIDEMAADAEDLDLARTAHTHLHGSSSGLKIATSRQMRSDLQNLYLIPQRIRLAFSLLKLRSVEESAGVSLNNIKVAAYQDEATKASAVTVTAITFSVTNNSPLPWTACAFIQYMTCTEDGFFSAWGKDMGGYSANPEVAAAIEETYHHSKGGYNEAGEDVYPCKDDRGYDWWTTDGELVLEDPDYCASVSFQSGSWIELLTKLQ